MTWQLSTFAMIAKRGLTLVSRLSQSRSSGSARAVYLKESKKRKEVNDV